MIPMARMGRESPMIPMARVGRASPMIPTARMGRSPMIPMARVGRSPVRLTRAYEDRLRLTKRDLLDNPFKQIPMARIGRGLPDEEDEDPYYLDNLARLWW